MENCSENNNFTIFFIFYIEITSRKARMYGIFTQVGEIP